MRKRLVLTAGLLALFVLAVAAWVLLLRATPPAVPPVQPSEPPRPSWESALEGVYVGDIAPSPDGRLLAWAGRRTRSGDFTEVGLISVADGRPLRSRTVAGDILALAWAPDSSLLAVSAYYEPILLLRPGDLSVASRLGPSEKLADGARSLVFSPDGGTLAAGDGVGNVRLWDLGRLTARPVGTLPLTAKYLAFSPSGRQLAGANFTNGVAVWDLEGGRGPWEFEAHSDPETKREGICGVFWRGEHPVTAGVDGAVRAWDVAARAQAAAHHAGVGEIEKAAVTADGKSAVLAGDADLYPPQVGSCVLMSLPSGKVAEEFGPYRGSILSVAISPDGRSVYVGCGWAWKRDPFNGAVYRFSVISKSPK